MLGVLDRYEGDLAVILLEDQQDECILPIDKLPENSVVGTVFNMTADGESYTVASINMDETNARKEHATQLLHALQKKKKKSKFKR